MVSFKVMILKVIGAATLAVLLFGQANAIQGKQCEAGKYVKFLNIYTERQGKIGTECKKYCDEKVLNLTLQKNVVYDCQFSEFSNKKSNHCSLTEYYISDGALDKNILKNANNKRNYASIMVPYLKEFEKKLYSHQKTKYARFKDFNDLLR
jgi:hypothetical protein